MHPILATKTRLAVYLFVWVLLVGLLKNLLYFQGFTLLESLVVTTPLCVVYAFVCLSPWYSCRVLPLAPGNMRKVIFNHVLASIVAGFFFIILAKGLGLLLSRWNANMDARLSRTLPNLLTVGILVYILAVSLHYVMLSFQHSRDAEVQAQQARVLAREAELKALKAQINPHFLFNSLNSISSLVTVDGARAREMCIGLSDFLRSTLSLGDKEVISFAEELALVRTYLGVEKVRFGARLRVEESVDPNCSRCSIPPLLVQPLVENAIKHGVAGLLEGGTIRLDASCQDGLLRLRVENEFDAEVPAPQKSGLGLKNVRSRLEARYEHRARLATEIRGRCFLAELIVPCEEHAHV